MKYVFLPLRLEEVLPPAPLLVVSVRTGFGDSAGQSCLSGCSEGPSLFHATVCEFHQ